MTTTSHHTYRLREDDGEPNTKSTPTVFRALWNLPGCLPEMEPFASLNADEAREFLCEELDRLAKEAEENDVTDAERITDVSQAIAKGDVDSVTLPNGYVYSIEAGGPVDDDEERRCALAQTIGCSLSDVESARGGENTFEADGGEFCVLTDDEADALWDEYLDSYIDECVLPELDSVLARYFDRDAWKRDARAADGRGHSLASYDSTELKSACGRFFIFRTN